jgi:hypothetical protein
MCDLYCIAARIASNGRVGMTVGDLKEAVRLLQDKEKGEKIQDLLEKGASSGAKSALKALIGLVPGGGTVAEVLDFVSDISGKDPVGGLLKGLFNKFKNTTDSEAAKNPIMKAMDIDDIYAQMLDDDLEKKFIQFVLDELDKMDDSADLPEMTEVLEDWVIQNYEGHGIFK